MARLSKEFKVGLLVVVSAAILYLGFKYLKGIQFFSSEKTFYVIYNNVEGLSVSDPIKLSGISVGRVEKIDLMPGRENQVLVKLMIDQRVQVNDSTTAFLADDGLLGGKTIVLRMKKGKRILDGNDTLPAVIQRSIGEIIAGKEAYVDSIIYNVQSILSQLNRSNKIESILIELKETAHSLNLLVGKNTPVITETVSNLNEFLKTLKQTANNLQPVIKKLDVFTDSLKNVQLVQTVENLKRITQSIESGKGTLGKLIKDDSLYSSLTKTVKDLDLLLIDIKAKPKRYVHFSVFGKKDK